MIREAGARPAALAVLGRDQFGNYVVQRCLEVATPPQKTALLEALQVCGGGGAWCGRVRQMRKAHGWGGLLLA